MKRKQGSQSSADGDRDSTITLEEVMKGKTEAELRKIAKVAFSEMNFAGATRDELAQKVAAATLDKLEPFVDFLVCSLGDDEAEVFRRLVFDGPQTLSTKNDVENAVAHELTGVFWLDCKKIREGKHSGGCRFAMPEEFRRHLSKGNDFEKLRTFGDMLADLTEAAVNLYGVVSMAELHSLIDRYLLPSEPHGDPDEQRLPPFFVNMLVVGREYDCNYVTWKDYVCHLEFEDDKKHMGELIDSFIAGRDKHKRWYPADRDEFCQFRSEGSFLLMPECERLVDFFAEHGFADEKEMVDALLDAVGELQIGTKRPAVIINSLLGKCKLTSGEQVEEFCRLWEDFANNLHRRDLNGQTPNMAMAAYKGPLVPVVKVNPKAEVGRNDLCPCGSGKKFKKCCGKKAKARDAEDALASERLAVYLPMREMQMRFVSKCVMPLCDHETFVAATDRLGITCATVGSEDNIETLSSVVGDYAAMMDDSLGLPPIKRLLENPEQFTGDRRRVLEMYRQYRYTWLKALEADPGVGIKCRDLLTGEEVYLMETKLSRTFGISEMTICVGAGELPNGTIMALGTISTAGFDNPEAILKIVLSHLGIPSTLPIRLSFADQARFAAETIKRINSLGRYRNIVYGGLEDR